MSQGPRTRVRLDGEHYTVLRSARGTIIYRRTMQEGERFNVLVWDSRPKFKPLGHFTITDTLAARILAAEAESV